jgi:hypothetical protein
VEKSRAAAPTWVHIKRAVRKASNFSKPVSTARQMVRSEVSMITRICCTSFSKSPRLRTPSSFRVFHLWRGPARDFDAKPRLFEWASYSCNVTPLPAIPIPSLCIHGTHFPLCRSFCRVTVASSTHVSMFSTTWAPNGSGSTLSAFQPLAISPY